MKNLNLERKENNMKGITLVSLVITIIILLILATVSINLVINNGIIDKAKTAVDKYSDGEIEEQIKLTYLEWQTAKLTGETKTAQEYMEDRLRETLKDYSLTVTGSFKVTLSNGKEFFYNAKLNKMVDSELDLFPTVTATSNNRAVKENSIYIVDEKKAVIPKGYAISNKTNEQSIDNGLVVKKDGNEFVWIPVSSSDLFLMYTIEDTGLTMRGTEILTNYKSKQRADISSDLTRGYPETIDFIEPDILDDKDYDRKQSNLESAGFSTYTEMARALRDDYKNMIDSVKKHGGFYVGRYELGINGIKAGTVMNNTNWYDLYRACKNFSDESVESRMIWGCQWDQICKFISTAKDGNGDIISLADSRKYGNYSNSQSPANTNNGSNKFNNTTGRNEKWKTNNIYDLAGNCWEWTQEAYDTIDRAGRGGSYYSNGDNNPVTYRNRYHPTQKFSTFSSRPTLYIN